MSAIISPCGLYRYRLERSVGMVGPVYAFFGINPSTADARDDDATVRKWTGFVKTWGGSRFIVGNVSPLRATDVRKIKRRLLSTQAYADNLRHLESIVAEADVLVPCWGDRGKVPHVLHDDVDRLLAMLLNSGKPVMHLGLTKSGDPKHPLMLAYSTPLMPWKPSMETAQ
ncbi:DUF1643 domain-containing protein [Pigmentiphaga sp. YJ18]|uniref:DUF1643 domain-containing protein n=1 Tax=Pigmentiphaga sp. YJ18 TaxID=3134907 RepID=UPI003116C0C5